MGTIQVAVYTGSFDPMTLGHLDVITRASKLFKKVIVAVGEARGKAPLFTTAERLDLLRATTRDLGNVEVASFTGLAVDFAARQGPVALVRGLRSATDFAYEMQMAGMNHALKPAIDTVFLPTSPLFSHISSTLAKEIAHHGGDLTLLVPPLVAQKLSEKQRG